jgi:hypothetical protein
MVDKGDKRPVANLNQYVRINAWELLSYVVKIVSTASQVRVIVKVSEGLFCVPNNVEHVVMEQHYATLWLSQRPLLFFDWVLLHTIDFIS